MFVLANLSSSHKRQEQQYILYVFFSKIVLLMQASGTRDLYLAEKETLSLPSEELMV